MDIDSKDSINSEKIIDKEKNIKSFYVEMFESLKIIIISFVLIVGIRTFVMQPFFVSGKSMEPNFHNGDYLIVDELSYKLGNPKRGDVIVFHYPGNTSEYYIKRIIGLPGEKIEIRNGKIKIYNSKNPQGFEVKENMYLPENILTTGMYNRELKNNEYYVLGDNRPNSADSRRWGVLEEHFIVGKAWIRAWPLSNISIFESVEY